MVSKKVVQLSPHEVYRVQMCELKTRLQSAERVVQSPAVVTGLASLDAEFCFLQIRRIIELITFSAALREEARYKSLRQSQGAGNPRDHGDHTKDWNASEILKRLAEISLHFLPIPLGKRTESAPGLTHFDRSAISVTHGKLIDIYKTCGGFLHSKSPLGRDFPAQVEEERAKYKRAPAQIAGYLKFLRDLMWHHAAITQEWTEGADPKQRKNARLAWIVDFGGKEESDINIVVAAAVIEP